MIISFYQLGVPHLFVISIHCFQNTTNQNMEMTTPVFTRRTQSDGEKMEMTTPVITKKVIAFMRVIKH